MITQAFLYAISSRSPCAWGEEEDEGHDLETAGDHAEGEDELGESAEAAEVAGWADGAEAWADVVVGGGDGAEGGGEVEIFEADEHDEAEEDEGVEDEVEGDVVLCALVHGFSFVDDDADALWIDGFVEFAFGEPHEGDDAADLEPAGGGTGAAADEHEQEQDELAEHWPLAVVNGAEAGGGDDGGDVEEGVFDAEPEAVVHRQDVEDDGEHGGEDDGDEPAQLVAFQRFTPASAQGEKVKVEVDGEDEHAEGEDELDGHGFKGGDGGVVVGEAAGAGGGKGMEDGVVRAHAGTDEDADEDEGEHGVDDVEDAGDGAHAGEHFVESWPGHFAL